MSPARRAPGLSSLAMPFRPGVHSLVRRWIEALGLDAADRPGVSRGRLRWPSTGPSDWSAFLVWLPLLPDGLEGGICRLERLLGPWFRRPAVCSPMSWRLFLPEPSAARCSAPLCLRWRRTTWRPSGSQWLISPPGPRGPAWHRDRAGDRSFRSGEPLRCSCSAAHRALHGCACGVLGGGVSGPTDHAPHVSLF